MAYDANDIRITIDIDSDILRGKPKDVLYQLNLQVERVPEEYRDSAYLWIAATEEYSGSPSVVAEISYTRPKTREEIDRAEEIAKSRVEARRLKYLELKKEFGDD